HENEIGATTDVSAHPEFAARRTRKTIDGEQLEGWFTEDFTLAELKTLRARERLPGLRPGNTRFDGMFEVPALDEVLALVQALDWQRRVLAQQDGRPAPPPIGVYAETKHPSYFAGLGLPLEPELVRALQHWGYAGRDAAVFIQSFETANLKALRRISELRLVQLVDAGGRPQDLVLAGDPRTSTDLVTPRGLAEIASYADAIGVNKALIIPRAADGSLAAPSTLVADAHAAGLLVHAWTFRAENEFLPQAFRSGDDAAALGDMVGEVQRFLDAGIDGLFADQPDRGVRALQRK
ncbi:MAG: glycerophosphodiester phosphodiesterase family protein, partial [Gammaproteobacteria bacterium]